MWYAHMIMFEEVRNAFLVQSLFGWLVCLLMKQFAHIFMFSLGGGADPVWNQMFFFKVDEDNGDVVIKILDEDKHSADDIIGEAKYGVYPVQLKNYAVFNLCCIMSLE